MSGTTSVLNGLSSLSAFALANPQAEAIAALTLAGIAGAASLIAITFKEWKAYKSKKHKAKIDEVNALHRRFLYDLAIPGGAKVPGLPQIFQFSSDGKSINSLHYNDDEVRDIGRVIPQDPPELARYRQYVLDAILYLKDYYFAVEDSDDVTRGVLSYLLNILQNRCLSFVGYDYDITYLNALITFINNYASQKGTTKSVHFDRLKNVFSSLKFAVQDLEKHKETMSLLGLVNQTRSACLETSNELLRLQIKYVVPKDHQSMADTVTLADLSNDILRKKYIEYELWGIPLDTLEEIDLPKSIFHNWLKGLAKYYLQSLTPQALLQGEAMLRPEEIYNFIQWARPVVTKMEAAKKDKNLPQPTKADKKRLEHGLELIYQVFKQAPNLFTTKLGGTEKEPKYVTISTKDAYELIEASEAMADLAHLNHAIISLQALSAVLTGNMEELGLDFFDNQTNFNTIFAAFNTLYSVIQTDLEKIKRKIEAISVANKNTARLASELQLENELDELLKKIEFRVLREAEKVKNYKNKHPKTAETSEQEALTAAEFFQKMYTEPRRPQTYGFSIAARKLVSEPIEKKSDQDTVAEKEIALNGRNTTLFKALLAIQTAVEHDPQAKFYQKIYNTLKALHIKSIALLREKTVLADRKLKAEQIYQLTLSLYDEAIQFFSQTEDYRINEAEHFIANIHAKINMLETKACIDRHSNSVRKFIFETFGFFPTATRNKIAELEKACEGLTKETHPPNIVVL